MSNIDEFKDFVRKNPSLIKHVNTGNMTWQKFYEMHNLYGEDENVWNEYIKTKEEVKENTTNSGIGDLLNYFKGLNLDSIQNGVNNIQRVLGVLTDIKGTDNNIPKEDYKPRPIYKHFDD